MQKEPFSLLVEPSVSIHIIATGKGHQSGKEQSMAILFFNILAEFKEEISKYFCEIQV